jgi:hypothetical protein
MSKSHAIATGVAFGLVSLLLAPASGEENVAPAVRVGGSQSMELPASGTAVGDFDGDGLADAAFLRGTNLVYAHAMAFDGSLVETAHHAHDLVLVRGASPGQDRFATVGPEGLVLWRFDPTPAGGLVPTVVDSLAWRDARRVRAGDLDLDGDRDLVALDAAGTALLTMLASGTGLVPGPTVALAHEAHAIAVTPAPLPRVAAAGAEGIELVDPTGLASPQALAALPGAVHDVIGLADGGPTTRLAALVATTASAQLVVVLGEAGVDSSAFLAPGIDAVSLVALDHDGDGSLDLAVNARGVGDVGVFLSRAPATPRFDPQATGGFVTLVAADGLSQPDPEREARLAAFDLDGDGDLDLFHGDDPTNSLTVLVNQQASPDSLAPSLEAVLLESTDLGAGLRIRPLLRLPASVDPAMTHLEIAVWRRPLPGMPIDPFAVQNVHVALASAPSALAAIDDAVLTLPENMPGFATRYVLRLRMLGKNGQAIERGFPPAILELDLAPGLELALGSGGGAGAPIPEPTSPDPSSAPPSGGPALAGEPTYVVAGG